MMPWSTAKVIANSFFLTGSHIESHLHRLCRDQSVHSQINLLTVAVNGLMRLQWLVQDFDCAFGEWGRHN
jgi:hypothetical protein